MRILVDTTEDQLAALSDMATTTGETLVAVADRGIEVVPSKGIWKTSTWLCVFRR